MADASEKKTEKAEKAEEPRYALDQLVAESRTILSVAPHAARGAFHGEDRESLTVAEAEQKVAEFLKRKGKTS